MRKQAISLLLWLLNSRWLNPSPCRYGFIGNVDAFSIENLRSEVQQQPGLLVREIIEDAERFAACSIPKSGVTVIEADGTTHEASVWDLHGLRNLSGRKPDAD